MKIPESRITIHSGFSYGLLASDDMVSALEYACLLARRDMFGQSPLACELTEQYTHAAAGSRELTWEAYNRLQHLGELTLDYV